MKLIKEKWLLITKDYSAAAVIIGHIAYRITKLSFLNYISIASVWLYIICGICLLIHCYITTQSIKAVFKKIWPVLLFCLIVAIIMGVIVLGVSLR